MDEKGEREQHRLMTEAGEVSGSIRGVGTFVKDATG